MVRRIESVPGVQSAAVVAAGLPLETGGNENPGVRINGHLENPSVDYREVTPGYFRTLGVPLLAGRFFTPADSPDAAKVAVINAAFAGQYFHGENPIGQHLTLEQGDAEVVGVAGDVRSALNQPAPATYFVPIAQMDFGTDKVFQGWYPTYILVRATVKPLSLSRAVTDAVSGADPNIPIGEVRSMEEILSLSLAFNRFLMSLMSVFAGLALVLATVGIYGVLSYWVRQRTNEIGIRMALGAVSRDVLTMVVKQGASLGAIGIAAGLLASFGLTRLMKSLLYGVYATDPLTFAVVSLVLGCVTLLASYIPARRATKVDPIVALRYE